MFWRGRNPAPKPLLNQVKAVVSLIAGADRFFHHPSGENAYAAAQAKLEARRLRDALAHSLGSGPRRQDWLAVSRSLLESSDEAAWAVEETERFKAPLDSVLTRMSAGLRDASADIGRALEALGERSLCEDLLIAAKKRAMEVERLHRKARASALDEPNVVAGLKAREIARRLSQAAEALQRAADRIGETLMER